MDLPETRSALRLAPDEPAVALGTMYFGTTVDPATAYACLDAAYDAGVRLWDTANNYAFWVDGGTGDESETTLGEWLQRRPGRRDALTIATKVGARPRRPGADLSDAEGLSAPAIRRQLEGSLRRLHTDRVDLLYAHVDDRDVPLAETLGALGELVDEGLVGAIGASNLTAARLAEALATPAPHPYAVLQQRFTYLRPAADADLGPHVQLDDDVAAVCRDAGVATLGYSPLLSGAYTRGDRPLPEAYATPAADAALAALDDAARACGLDRGEVVLAWMAQRRPSVVPVVGVSSVEQVLSAARAGTATLHPALVERLDAARAA